MEDIVEFKFDYEKKIWIPLRHREDKKNPNARLTVLSALKALEEHITIDEIGEFKPEKSYYSQIVKEKFILRQIPQVKEYRHKKPFFEVSL